MKTRQEAIDIIRGGESFIFKGQIISRVEDLPSAAEWAEADPTSREILVADYEAKIAQLQAELSALKKGKEDKTPEFLGPPEPAPAIETAGPPEPKTEFLGPPEQDIVPEGGLQPAPTDAATPRRGRPAKSE